MRCICCNSKLDFDKKMRPVTTRIVAGDKLNQVEGFPKDKLEEYCQDCLNSINGINSDLDPNSTTYIKSEDNWTTRRTEEFSIDEFSEDGLAKESEEADRLYQGWGETINLYD